MKIAPGVTINLSKSGASLSLGPRGAKATFGPRGVRGTVGIPGTGLFYTATSKGGSKRSPQVSTRRSSKPSLGFFKRLVTPDDHESLFDGCVELLHGNGTASLEHLRKASHLADGAYLAGCICLMREEYAEASRHLMSATQSPRQLGSLFLRYDIDATWYLPVSPNVVERIEPNLCGALLVLVEVYQRQDRWQEAVDVLRRLRRLEPDDIVISLSFAELLMTYDSPSRKVYRKVVKLSDGISNESVVHAALMFHRGTALRALGTPQAACQVLTAALRRRKDRPADLLRALRYQRALAYEELGKHSRSRADLERIYGEQSDYEDVAERLGV